MALIEFMNRSYIAAAVLACLASVAAAQAVPKLDENALRAVLSGLKDPDSVKFRDVHFKATEVAGAWKMCGYLNAKNSYGAYVGYSRFYGMFLNPKGIKPQYLVMSTQDEAANQLCEKDGM